MTTLDVVIVSFNARADLDRCLESLHASPPATAHEIVVVDNASTDGSPDLVTERWPSVRVIRNERNVGFARANNMGIRDSSGDLVLLLNSDTLVPPGAIDRLVGALVAEPAAAAAGPRLVDGSGRVEVSWGSMLSPFAEARQKLAGALYERGFHAIARRIEVEARRRRFPDWVSGACLLVWRRDAVAVGLLDERYFMYAEDVDFCAALRARGRRVLFAPEVEVVHLRGRSRDAAPAATRLAYRRSQVAFYEKHHPAWAPCLRLYLRLKRELPPPNA